MYTALKARIPFLDINQERDFGYEGYTGMVELARQLCLTIESPVWEAVRRPAPWGGRDRYATATTPPGEPAATDGRAGERDRVAPGAPSQTPVTVSETPSSMELSHA